MKGTPVRLTYPGPSRAVTVMALGVSVARGGSIDISGADMAADLISQGWQIAAPAKPPAAKAKGAPKGTNNTPKEG